MAMTVNRGLAMRAGLWSAVESGGLSLLSFATLVAFSRLLSPADFGVFAIALSTIEILALLPNMMFHDALIQRQDCEARHEGTASFLSLAMAVTICVGCWLAAPFYAQLVDDPRAGTVLAALSIGLLFAGPVTPIVARQKRGFGYRLLAIRSLVGRLLGAGLGVAAALAGAGVWSLVIQWIAMQVLGSLVLVLTADVRPRPCFDRRAAGDLLRFGVPALAALFATYAMRRALMIFAGILLGAQATGMLNLASRLVDTFWSVACTAISQVGLSTLTALRGDPLRQRHAYLQAVHLASMVFFPSFVGMAIVTPELITVLFGARWIEAAPLASGLALVVLVPAVRLFMPAYLTSLGKPGTLLRINGITFVVFLVAVAAIRPVGGLLMIAILAAAECLTIVLFARVLMQRGGISAVDHLRAIAGPAIATSIMAAIALPVQLWTAGHASAWFRLVIVAATGASVYIAVLAMTQPRLAQQAARWLRARLNGRSPELRP